MSGHVLIGKAGTERLVTVWSGIAWHGPAVRRKAGIEWQSFADAGVCAAR